MEVSKVSLIYIPVNVPKEFEQMLNDECLLDETVNGHKIYSLTVPGTQDLIMNTIELTLKKLRRFDTLNETV